MSQPHGQPNMLIHEDGRSFSSGYSRSNYSGFSVESDHDTSSSFPSLHSRLSSIVPSFISSLPSPTPPISSAASSTAVSRRSARTSYRWKVFHFGATCFFLVAASAWQWAVRNRVRRMTALVQSALDAQREVDAHRNGIRAERTSIVELHRKAQNLTLRAKYQDRLADAALRADQRAMANATQALDETIHDLKDETIELERARSSLTAGAVQDLVGYWFELASQDEAKRAEQDVKQAQSMRVQASRDRDDAATALERSHADHQKATDEKESLDSDENASPTGICKWFLSACDWFRQKQRRQDLKTRSEHMENAADDDAQAYMEMVEYFRLQRKSADDDVQAWNYEYRSWLDGNSSIHLHRDAEYHHQAARLAYNDTRSDVDVARADELDAEKELMIYESDVTKGRRDRNRAERARKQADILRTEGKDAEAQANELANKIRQDEKLIRNGEMRIDSEVNRSFEVVATCLWFAMVASCTAGILTLLVLIQVQFLGSKLWKEHCRGLLRPLISHVAGTSDGSVVDARQLARLYMNGSYIAAHCIIFLSAAGYVSDLLSQFDGRMSSSCVIAVVSFALLAATAQIVLLHAVPPLVSLPLNSWRVVTYDFSPLVSFLFGECFVRLFLLFAFFLLEFAIAWMAFGETTYYFGSTWLMWANVCICTSFHAYYRQEHERLEEGSVLSRYATGGSAAERGDGASTITTTGSLAAITTSTEHSSLVSENAELPDILDSSSGFSSWNDFCNLVTIDLSSAPRQPSTTRSTTANAHSNPRGLSPNERLESILSWNIAWRYEFHKLHLTWNTVLLVWALSVLQCDWSLLLHLQPLSREAPTSTSTVHWGHASFGLVAFVACVTAISVRKSRNRSRYEAGSSSETQPLRSADAYYYDDTVLKTLP